jgi:chitinase
MIGRQTRQPPTHSADMCFRGFLSVSNLWVILLLCVIFLQQSAAEAGFWTTAYFPGYEQDSIMPASAIDFTAVTHIIHFAVFPNSDGTLNTADNDISQANSFDLVSRAHAAGVKVLFCIGGANSESAFQGATSPATLPVFINNLTNFLAARGYDGVDIDWEPFPSTDDQQYASLVTGLRSALNQFSQPGLLTAAAESYPPYGDSPTAEYQLYATLQSQFDQINIMTYDLSGPYEGWVTWFNSPIYNGGYRFPSSGGLVPCVDAAVTNFLVNGVAPDKLAVGIPFYGYVWTGGSGPYAWSITQPRQSWTNAPTITAYRFTDIMTDYYQSNLYHWDSIAQAAYLSITNPIETQNEFISYDDQRACQAKVSYARNHGLGGVMIWELGQDHQADLPDPLLQAIKQALATPGVVNLQPSNNDIVLSFNGITLGSYSVQWKTNCTEGAWNTLLITNIANTGGIIQITDGAVISNQFQRFYRVKTPP